MCWTSKALSTRLLNLTEFNRKRVQSFVLWGGNKDRIVNQSLSLQGELSPKFEWAIVFLFAWPLQSFLFNFGSFLLSCKLQLKAERAPLELSKKHSVTDPALHQYICFVFLTLKIYDPNNQRLARSRWQLPPHRLIQEHVLCLEIFRCELSHPQH